jgi:hypothetical protein
VIRCYVCQKDKLFLVDILMEGKVPFFIRISFCVNLLRWRRHQFKTKINYFLRKLHAVTLNFSHTARRLLSASSINHFAAKMLWLFFFKETSNSVSRQEKKNTSCKRSLYRSRFRRQRVGTT